MLKIAVCDDEINEISSISSFINTYMAEHDIPISYKCYTSSVELASKSAYEKYDLYLLDVIMPVLNGMSLAREIRSFDKAADIIFLTASPEFAVESYTVKAANYLLKPITRDKLFGALDDILEKKESDSPKYIVVKNSSGVHKLLLSNIVCVEAFNRKVIYYLTQSHNIKCFHIVISLINYNIVFLNINNCLTITRKTNSVSLYWRVKSRTKHLLSII